MNLVAAANVNDELAQLKLEDGLVIFVVFMGIAVLLRLVEINDRRNGRDRWGDDR